MKIDPNYCCPGCYAIGDEECTPWCRDGVIKPAKREEEPMRRGDENHEADAAHVHVGRPKVG